MEKAKNFYHSGAYQATQPLRKNKTKGDVILVRGVSAFHKVTNLLS